MSIPVCVHVCVWRCRHEHIKARGQPLGMSSPFYLVWHKISLPLGKLMSFWRFSYLLLSPLLKGRKGLQALVLLYLVLMWVLGNQNSSCQAHEACFTHRTNLPACIFNCAFSMFKYQYAVITYMVHIVVSSSTGLIWEWQPVTY